MEPQMPHLGDDEWQGHAELIGRVTIAWNHCVHQLLRVFRHLTGMPPGVSAEIFLGQRSDQGQRHMLKRLAVAVDIGDGPRADLGKLLKRLDDVSGQRNMATHTIFGLSLIDPETSAWSPRIAPALASAHNGKLAVDFVTQFETAERDLREIYRDLETWLIHTPFPARAWGLPALLGEPPPYVEPLPDELSESWSAAPSDWSA
jgi:hypothetical protein